MKNKKELEEKKKKEFVKRMEYEKHKRGITKQKEDYEEQKGRKYVRDLNEMYSIINPAKHIEITEGTKREGIKHCNTKSQWKYNREELEKEGKVIPEIVEIAENNIEKPILDLETKKERVILIVDRKAYIKEIEIEPAWLNIRENISYGKIRIGKEKHEIEIERIYPEEKEIYETDYGEMTGKMLLEISISTGVKIYEMK